MSPQHMISWESMKFDKSVNADRIINAQNASRNILIIALLFPIIEAIYSITSHI